MRKTMACLSLLLLASSLLVAADTPTVMAHKRVANDLGKEGTYYALRYTHSVATPAGGIRKGTGMGTYLKLYDLKGKYLGTISQGHDGKYHQPTWLKITGTLSKEDAATAATQRLIKGTDLPDIVIAIKTEKEVPQPESIFKAEIADITSRIKTAMGDGWELKITLVSKLSGGLSRGFHISGTHRTEKAPGMRKGTTWPASFYIWAYGITGVSPQIYRDTSSALWMGESPFRTYYGSMHRAEGKGEGSIAKIRSILDAKDGLRTNGLRMSVVSLAKGQPGKDGSRPWIFRGVVTIRNISNRTIALMPDGDKAWGQGPVANFGVTPSRLASQPADHAMRILQPGQSVSIPFDLTANETSTQWAARQPKDKNGQILPKTVKAGEYKPPAVLHGVYPRSILLFHVRQASVPANTKVVRPDALKTKTLLIAPVLGHHASATKEQTAK